MVQKLVAVVDTQFDNKISIGQVNLGDKVNLELEVTMGGEPLVYENPTFNLIAKKSDGTRVRQTEGITLSGGTVIIDCDEQLSTYKGAVSSQLIIKDGDRVSTCIFYFTVGASLEADIIVNSIDKVNTLDDLDELISAGFENLAIFEAKLSEYEVDLGSIIAEESKRITNENLRVTGEADRKASESERITAESVRSASESARVSSEEERIANEMDRVDNEADRRMAENIRKSNEAKREAAEEERANLFELNEEIRKEQEKQRVLNEKRRVEAFDNLEDREGIRLMAEQNRVTAENEREVAEANRRTAELEREAAEENREATYTAFNEAESERVSSEIARKTAEANRVEAEARRVEAESNRDYLYRNAEENRDSSYASKESSRDSKYAQAEKNRDALFESNEANRMDSYTTAERKRVENENIRQANEVARDKAEVVRANGELAREGKESARVQAESKRVTAEQSRVTAEQSRVTAEQSRVTAESKRVTDFEKIKSDISTLDSKLTQKVDTKIADLEALNSNFKQDITAQYEDIVTEFDKVIANVTNGNENATNSEIVQARGKEVNLNARLDNFDEQLETMENELENQISRLDTVKANNSITENLQTQINNLVLESGGDSNLEVVQARGDYGTLNDRIDNVEIVKSYDDVMPVTDISYNLAKASTFTMTGFNGTDLVKIPVGNFNGETKYTVIMKFTSDAHLRSVFKIYDNTWGSGKVVKDLGTTEQGAIKYMSIDIDVSGYDQFALLRLAQIGQEYGATVNLEYLKVVKTNSLADIDNFDELFNSFGDVQTYIVPRLKVLPSNIIDLLSKKEMPSNTKSYIDAKTEGSEALKIFDAKSIKNNIYNYEIPKQVITNEGNGTKIVQIPLSDLANLSDEVTLVIKYRLNSKSTKTTYALRIFDENWGAGIVKDLSGNNIKNKEYFVTYTFNKSQFKDWVLFRFSRIGDSGEVVLDIDYVKLFNSEDFTGTDEIDGLHNIFGNIEEYPLVNFKVIPSNLENMLEKENKNIVMIGDSIANQFAGAITDNNGNSEYNFMNKCIGGETTLDTMARLGAIPYTVLPPFTIPSDTSNSEEVNIVSSLFLDVEFNEVTAKPTWKNGYLSNYSANENGLNPYSALKCEIAGVKGTLYFKRSVGSTYFKRDIAGEQVVIDRPTEVIPIETSAYDKDAVYTCFMGTNEGWCNRFFEKDRTQVTANKKDAELLFSYYKRISQYINTNKFLFMGFYMCAFLDQQTADKRIEFWDYFEELMSKEFGNNYFSVRKYLREIGYKDANIQLTSQDLQDIKDGKIPIIASTGAIDGVHVTSRVAACVGNEILKRLKGLGYISSYNEIDVMKYDNGQTSTNPDDFLPPQE